MNTMGASLRMTARVARAPRPRLLGFRRGRLAGARRTSSGRAAGSGRLLDRLAGVLHVLPEAAHRVLAAGGGENQHRSEEHTSELQSLMRISYAGFCLKKQNV